MSPETLARRPAADRAKMFSRMKGDFGKLAVKRAASTPEKIRVVMADKEGNDAIFSFDFERRRLTRSRDRRRHRQRRALSPRLRYRLIPHASRLEVVRRAAEGRWPAGRGLVGGPHPARPAAGRLRGGDRRSHRRGAARRQPRPARSPPSGRSSSFFRSCRRPSGDQRQPWGPHRGVALRPADRGLRAPAGHGPPRGPGAGERSDRRARFRSRHDRPAAVVLDGLHRQRAGRNGRRRRRGVAALRLRVVGADRAGRRLAGDALAAA